MQYIKKCKTVINLIRGKRWGAFWDKLPFIKQILSSTNLLPHRSNYKYILIGGHGLGMTAFFYYLEKLGAKPLEIWSYEIVRPFVFYRKFDGMVLDKAPLNSQSAKILKTCTKKVPLYQLIRDPISTIKSNVNVTMFHSISRINNKNDANNMLVDVINNISHLMFYFASTRDLVNHIVCDVTYIKMKDIDDKNMPNTLKAFANRFDYNYSSLNGGGGNESVIKGSIFPRCFPHIFKINDFIFIISTLSRLNGRSRKEMDINSDITEIRTRINKKFFVIDDNIIIKGYEEYPLVLATFNNTLIPENILEQSKNTATQYIDFALKNINKHKELCFDENGIIDFLLTKKEFAKKLAIEIHNQLRYIRQESPESLEEFAHTKRFLDVFGIDINSNKGVL
ncbi:hypothetical protein [Helicobacter sp. 16-1353]|uniref:hypothetical protein n=1 Tax=Helicobacter sp. 16-1353 TaxID=2004996 RepID=UPI0011BFA29D|nr:hypothetical protein [Helicobacter sp. 16-1353]